MSISSQKRIFPWRIAVGFFLLICLCIAIPLSIGNSPIMFYQAILVYLGVLPTDNQLVDEYFGPRIVGYSQVEILEGKGKGDSSQDPRFITVRMKLDTPPDPITCLAQIHNFRGDPGSRGYHWFNLDCVGKGDLIGRASAYLLYSDYGPFPGTCPDDNAALLLKYWVEEGRIKMTDIKNPGMRSRVNELIEKKGSPPAANATGISLFRISDITVIDLAPELPNEKKTHEYVLRGNGTLEIWLSKSYVTDLDLKICDGVISPPLTPPAIPAKP